jgi:signal transduction histidine kinase
LTLHSPSNAQLPAEAARLDSHSAWGDYGAALLAVLAALLLRFVLNPILGNQGPYLILTLPVVLAALYGGFGPAIFATVLSTLAGTWLFIGSGGGLSDLLQPANFGRTVLFVLIGTSISFIGGRLRRSRLQLAGLVRQLRVSNRAKDDALATLGHEIRNPLAALLSAQQVLRLAPDQPDKVVRATGVIERQVAQIARMADDLLDLSSITRGEVAIRTERVDLRDVLAQAQEQSRPLMAAKAHHLQVDLGTAGADVVGDRARLVQVFANLLGNAAKYTDAGGELVLAMAPATHGRVAVDVRDNGTGMDPDGIAELFEPFVQAPAALGNAERGLGLGLAIVRKIVQLHGGEVQASSAGLGMGSTFTVLLPLAAA